MRRNRTFYLYVPRLAGRPKLRSTETKDVVVFKAMRTMVRQLKDEHRWAILDSITSGRKSLAEVFAALQPIPYTFGRVRALEAELASVDLSQHLTDWLAWVKGNRRADVRTPVVYWQQVTSLVKPGESFPASSLTKAKVTAWLSGLGCTSGTKRKYLSALRSFIRYLNDVGVLDGNPVAGITPPKKNPARTRWVTAQVDEAIVQAASPKYRAFFAFLKSTGADVGSAQRTLRGDLDLAAGRANVRGTKTHRRAVPDAVIEPWALPYLKAFVKEQGIVGGAVPLWPDLTESGALHHHEHCCAKLGVSDYTLKDSRHSVGVRMRKAGKSFEQIAAQLGTSVYHAATVYAVYDIREIPPTEPTPPAEENQA